MNKARAILISDIHFSVSTLELASSALRQALDKAKELHIPLVIAGDTLDSKAIIRGECANRLIEILSAKRNVRVLILVGNHDLLNEKGKEHTLNFLRPYCEIVDSPVFDDHICAWLFPYFSDTKELLKVLKITPNKHPIIMHQGVQGADMGSYVIDKTSLPKEVFKNFRVISGHYHKAQDINCAVGKRKMGDLRGTFSYIGSPYTISFAEANDGPKGFRVLYEDGNLELIQIDLRRHIIYELSFDKLEAIVCGASGFSINHIKEDLIWIKVTGPQSELDKINKKDLGIRLFGHSNYKLDKIPTDSTRIVDTNVNLTDQQILDNIIDSRAESEEYKKYLKGLWREIITS